MAIPDEDVAKVRSATDIAALIGERTALKKVGRRLTGLCPFHSEKSPSFSVNPEEGVYYCFGCQAHGDAITFIRAVDGLDFVEAIERLASRAGITIRNDADPADSESRQRRNQMYDALEAATAYYHQVLLNDRSAAPARKYLRERGYDGDVVRQFRIGFAPASFDALLRKVKFPERTMVESGLLGKNDRGRVYDMFRERIIFPIFDAGGRAIALGGRILPEEMRTMTGTPGPKYRNSSESPIYQKRATLYGLNWAKTDITATREAVVCEGYTDVIGFFRAAVPRAVATCGTSLTEDHVRVLSRFAPRVVLCFDQDKAGQNAAARLYEWERRHEIELAVAALPDGADPADLARTDPDALRDAIATARPFLGFKVERALASEELSTPESRARAAERAIEAIAEHPNAAVREPYLFTIADRLGLSDQILRGLLTEAMAHPRPEERPAPVRVAAEPVSDDEPPPRDDPEYFDDTAAPPPSAPPPMQYVHSNFIDEPSPDAIRAERNALWLAIHEPADVAAWIEESLFGDPLHRDAIRVLLNAASLHAAIEDASPATSQLIARVSGYGKPDDFTAEGTFIELVRQTATRTIAEYQADARRAAMANDLEATAAVGARIRWLKGELEVMGDIFAPAGSRSPAIEAANRLLAWLEEGRREG